MPAPFCGRAGLTSGLPWRTFASYPPDVEDTPLQACLLWKEFHKPTPGATRRWLVGVLDRHLGEPAAGEGRLGADWFLRVHGYGNGRHEDDSCD